MLFGLKSFIKSYDKTCFSIIKIQLNNPEIFRRAMLFIHFLIINLLKLYEFNWLDMLYTCNY